MFSMWLIETLGQKYTEGLVAEIWSQVSAGLLKGSFSTPPVSTQKSSQPIVSIEMISPPRCQRLWIKWHLTAHAGLQPNS